jgi:hypothetical protein
MLPVVGKNVRRAFVVLVALAVAAGVVVLFFVVTKQVRKGLDNATNPGTVSVSVPVAPLPHEGKGGTGRDDSSSGDYADARAVYKAMNAHGAKCTQYNEVVNSSVVSAATCVSGTEYWTIQVFFDDLSYNAVVSNYKSSDTIHVAYGGNWTVLTQTKEGARRIAEALDGSGK